ncbi:hypothetical protein [Mycolicibacterium sp. XJ879]
MKTILQEIAGAVLVALVAGCSSSPSAGTSDERRASDDDSIQASIGSMNDWVRSVCSVGFTKAFEYPVPQWGCRGYPEGGGFSTHFFIFQFTSQSQMRAYPQYLTGRYSYASCTAGDGSITVFVSDVSGFGNKEVATRLTDQALQPLTEYRCSITSSNPYRTPTAPSTVPALPMPTPRTAPPPVDSLPRVTTPANALVRTASGKVRCIIEEATVSCQYPQGFPQAPVETYGDRQYHWNIAKVTDVGAFEWRNGNIPGDSEAMARDVVLNYGTTYKFLGWTIWPTIDGTRITNDQSGRGMFVSVENVYPV